MQVRGYCNYKVTMPAGKSFPGEKLLVEFSTDAIRAMEHQADLIALAHDIRLKQRRPIDLDDKELVAGNYIRFTDQGMRTAPSSSRPMACTISITRSRVNLHLRLLLRLVSSGVGECMVSVEVFGAAHPGRTIRPNAISRYIPKSTWATGSSISRIL